MFRRIFGSVDSYYLRRSYFIGAIFFSFFVVMQFQTGWSMHGVATQIVPGLICLALFPFSKLVYDELKRFVLGENVFYINALVMLFAKLIINLFLFMGAWFIAPIGIAYLWYKSKDL